jgi:hypothetical protein
LQTGEANGRYEKQTNKGVKMRKILIDLEKAPPIYVWFCESVEELSSAASAMNPNIRKNIDRIDNDLKPIGLTIGFSTLTPSIHVYLAENLPTEQRMTTIAHESVHAACCVLRHRVYHNMGRNKILPLTDTTDHVVPGFEALKISINGTDEEELAHLTGIITCKIMEAIWANETEEVNHATEKEDSAED